MSNDTIEVNNPESWSIGRRYASLLGPIPSSVSGAIRALWANHDTYLESGVDEYTGRIYSAVRRVDRSAVLKTPIYFAALALYSDKFSDTREDDTSKALVQICGSGMFATLLGLIYTHKRFSKVCKAEEWGELSKEFILNMEYGYQLGLQVEGFDPAIGMLAGGVRYTALATFLMRDRESYNWYRVQDKLFNLEVEHKKWGCDHGQIAGYIMRALGYSGDHMSCAYSIRGYVESELNKSQQLFRTMIQLLDVMLAGKSLNEANFVSSEFTLSEDQYEALASTFKALKASGTSFDWMTRSVKEEETSE